MKFSRTQLGIGAVVAALIFVATFLFFTKKSVPTSLDTVNSNTNKTRQFVPNPVLETAYETKVSNLLNKFDNGEVAGNIRQELLDLTVPDKYKNLHLDLVMIFDQLEAGRKASAQDRIEAALEELEKVRSNYPWIH